MSRALTDAQVDAIAEALIGQCVHDIEHFALEMFGVEQDALTTEDHQALDAEVFLCSRCGWWDALEEQAEGADRGEPFCRDCDEGMGT